MKYQVETACEQGAVRPNNEDAIRYGLNQELGILWMVTADGMGGHNAGEIASEMLVDYIEKQLTDLKEKPQQAWTDWIKQKISYANELMIKAAKNNPEYQGMGTTGVVIVIDHQQCHIGWVGDSRAYLLRDNRLTQQTQDHSMLQYLLNKGAITPSEAQMPNARHLLSRAIGIKQKLEVDVLSLSIKSGDTLMLSTDGVHDYLTDKEITQLLLKYAASTQNQLGENVSNGICSDMINLAIKQSSKDNLTIGLIKIYN